MTQGKEWKLILLFTLPLMAGNLLQQLYNTVDGIIAGNFISENALGAIGTIQPLTFMFLSFAMGLSVGVGVVISQRYGANKELSVSVDTSLILLGAVGALFMVVGVIATPFLVNVVMGVHESLREMSIIYLRIYCLGLFFQFVYNCIAAILRAVGDSRATLYFLLISTVVNTGLDLLFVAVFKWNVAGTAIATVIAQAACAAVSYIYLRRKFPFVRGTAHFDKAICKTITRLGIPSAIQQSIVALGNVAMNRLVNSFGEATVNAYSAGVRITSFVIVPIMGFQAGLANFTGQNIGAGRLDRVRRGLRDSLIMCLSSLIVLCVVLSVFARPVIGFFGLSGDALEQGVEQVQYLMKIYWIFGAYITLGGLLQGAGDTMLQSVATLSALLVRVIMGYAGVSMGLLGYEAAWVTNHYGWILALVITYVRYFTGGWKKKAVAGSLAKGAGAAAEQLEGDTEGSDDG